MAATLVAAGTASGALVGFFAGVGWAAAGLPRLPVAVVVVLVAAALAGDGAHMRGRAPAPLAVRRQVPQVWSQVFSPATVALLYGARLGVGPLTLLPSWTWWAVLVAGGSLGPGGSTLAGGAFGLARGMAMVAVAEAVRRDSVHRMDVLSGAEPAAGRVVGALAAGTCLLAAF